jgi:bifunctional oligoribonuclease and PAP phosphatase NrnA
MAQIGIAQLKETIKGSSNKKAILTFHSIGDTDAVSSAFALRELFKNATIATPDYITANSKHILENLGFDPKSISTDFDGGAELVILLDVNNFEDCGSFSEKLENFDGQILIIDHHTPNNFANHNLSVFNDESYNSTASIVFEILKSTDIPISKNIANLLATGIISDSAELRNAFPETFMQIGELLERSEMDYQSMLLEIHHVASPRNRSQFIADLFKCNVSIAENLLILSGAVQMHANKTADDAIKIGADVALFYSARENEVSFSARLRPPLDKVRGVNLGRIMKQLAPIINGQGGGHPCAAGAYGPGIKSKQMFIDAFMARIINEKE